MEVGVVIRRRGAMGDQLAALWSRQHCQRCGARMDKTKMLPLVSSVSITNRHGGGAGSCLPVFSGEARKEEGSKDMHTPTNHLL